MEEYLQLLDFSFSSSFASSFSISVNNDKFASSNSSGSFGSSTITTLSGRFFTFCFLYYFISAKESNTLAWRYSRRTLD